MVSGSGPLRQLQFGYEWAGISKASSLTIWGLMLVLTSARTVGQNTNARPLCVLWASPQYGSLRALGLLTGQLRAPKAMSQES